MQSLDWIVVWAYLSGMLCLALYLSRKQTSSEDYFLGSHNLSSKALAASTIATQCSTNSLLGAPAFVGFAAGGGLIWLQYELAVPLAMLALLWLMLPARQLGITSIYQILEHRIGRSTRLTAAGCFLLFRGVATAVTIYGSALVITLILDIGFVSAVGLLMVATLLYDYFGGLTAVVISDVVQLALLVGAVVFALFFIGDLIAWDFSAAQRTQTLVNDWGLNGQDYGFWPMLIGGVFLYAAYYGCDQSQAQRILAAKSESETAQVLLLNGLCRFPIVLLYCFLGLGLAAFAAIDPMIIDRLPETEAGSKNLNLVFPTFVLSYFQPGFVGLIMVGLIAASMSSIDSALNSLSAVTVEDFIRPRLTNPSPRSLLRLGQLGTVLWGLFAVGFAFQVEQIAPTVLEAVNKVGSMVNGPLLALVSAAILRRHTSQVAALAGFACGLMANAYVALLLPEVSWLWWNVIGFVVAIAVIGITNAALPKGSALADKTAAAAARTQHPPKIYPIVLGVAFSTILAILWAIDIWQP